MTNGNQLTCYIIGCCYVMRLSWNKQWSFAATWQLKCALLCPADICHVPVEYLPFL